MSGTTVPPDRVLMIALHTMWENADFTGRWLQVGDEFTPERSRGAELFGYGLAKYADTIEGAQVDDPAAVQVVIDAAVGQMNENNAIMSDAISRNKRK